MRGLPFRRAAAAAAVAAGLAAGSGSSIVSSQTPPQESELPPVVVIYREEVKPGKAAAHLANETGWAGMMAKAQWPTGWLGTVSLTGPSEAWFFTGFGSLAEWDKDRVAQEAAESLKDSAKFSAQDSDLLTRTSVLIGSYRPQLSYKPGVPLPKMRYFNVDTVVVKPGYAGEFAERWREIVAAHTKANMDEHWAVYEITSGAPAGTFMFFFPVDSLATLDQSGDKHRAAAYRDAVGEAGRARNAEMTRNAIVSQQSRILAFEPKMSYLDKQWVDADPAFWAPKPPPPPVKK